MSSISLADLQQQLQDFLLDKPAQVSDLTLETARFSRAERLGIYHQGYRLRLLDALRQDFPILEQCLGREQFAALADAYIAQHPSQNPSLRWLGKSLAPFMQIQQQPLHLCELAQFEWAQAMAFDAADTPLATLDDIRSLAPADWMNLQLEFHPSLQRLSCQTNAPEVWGQLHDNSELEPPFSPSTYAQREWLIWRADLQVVYRPLENAEAWCLDAFHAGQHFAAICEGLCEWFAEEQVPVQAAQFLQHWLQTGLVSHTKTNSL